MGQYFSKVPQDTEQGREFRTPGPSTSTQNELVDVTDPALATIGVVSEATIVQRQS